MRVDRWFAFVDLAGFTSFGDEYGDDESVRVLTLFRAAVRSVATDYGVRIAKWLGDGCMLVSVDPEQLVAGVCTLEKLGRRRRAAAAHPRGDGRRRGDPARRRRLHRRLRQPRVPLWTRPDPHEIFATPSLAEFAPAGTPVEPVGMLTVAGLHDPVEVVLPGLRARPGSPFFLGRGPILVRHGDARVHA